MVIKGKYRTCVSDPVQAFFRVLTGGGVGVGGRGGAAKAFKEVPNGSRKERGVIYFHLFHLDGRQ